MWGSLVAGVAWCALFGEYLMHRAVLHGTLFSWHPAVREHVRHHRQPFFAPLMIKAGIVVPLLFLGAWAAAHVVLGRFLSGFAFAVGVAGYYALFEVVHWSFHVHAPSTRWGLLLRKHHFFHHFCNTTKNYGFLAGIVFDVLLGTETDSKQQRVLVSRRYAIDWLHDGTTIRPEYAEEFEFRD